MYVLRMFSFGSDVKGNTIYTLKYIDNILRFSSVDDAIAPVGGGSSVVAQLLAGDGAIEESILRQFDEEAYDTCRRYIALHGVPRTDGEHFQSELFWSIP